MGNGTGILNEERRIIMRGPCDRVIVRGAVLLPESVVQGLIVTLVAAYCLQCSVCLSLALLSCLTLVLPLYDTIETYTHDVNPFSSIGWVLIWSLTACVYTAQMCMYRATG